MTEARAWSIAPQSVQQRSFIFPGYTFDTQMDSRGSPKVIGPSDFGVLGILVINSIKAELPKFLYIFTLLI